MKKLLRNLAIVFLLVCGFNSLFADEYEYPDIEDKYIGTYIPVDIEEEIKKTKDFYGALRLGYPKHHDVLFLGKNKCFSDAHFGDGYALSSKEIAEYHFETNEDGIFFVDKNGLKYHQISNFLNEYGYGYGEFNEYVLKIIFDDNYCSKNVKITSSNIELDGINYSINLDTNFFDTENVVYWLWSDKTSHCALIRNGMNGELHEGYQGEYKMWFPKEEAKAVYPLMFMDSNDPLPFYENLPKDQYRLLRNLVYARHGYIFKSEDLKAIFNQFSWYKPNPDFKESDLSKEEKAYVERMLKMEK